MDIHRFTLIAHVLASVPGAADVLRRHGRIDDDAAEATLEAYADRHGVDVLALMDELCDARDGLVTTPATPGRSRHSPPASHRSSLR